MSLRSLVKGSLVKDETIDSDDDSTGAKGVFLGISALTYSL